MAITTVDGIVAGFGGRTTNIFYKASLANAVAGQIFSLFQSAGLPIAGATPTSAAVCTNGLQGTIGFSTSNTTYLGKVGYSGTIAG